MTFQLLNKRAALCKLSLVLTLFTGVFILSTAAEAKTAKKPKTVKTDSAELATELPKKPTEKNAAEKKLPEKLTAEGMNVPTKDGSAAAKATPTDASAAEPEDSNAPTKQILFKTDGDIQTTEQQQPMNFKVLDTTAVSDISQEEKRDSPINQVEEQNLFKTYIGYPKQTLNVNVAPVNLSSIFTFQSRDYNFTSTSLGYGLSYQLKMTPIWSFDLSWSHFDASLAAATVVPYAFKESVKSYNNASFGADYCIVNKFTFLRKFCPGIVIAKDSYPILEFAGNSNTIFQMGGVDDIVVGLRATYQAPITDTILFLTTVGYNMGTGIGNSGFLTSKDNSNLYVKAEGTWSFKGNQDVGLGFDAAMRTASLEGKLGSNTFEWKTASTLLGFKVMYDYSF